MQLLFNLIEKIFPNYNGSNAQVNFLGGMTNKNYLIILDNQKYVVRIPGAMTDKLINRYSEADNSIKASNIKINVETYFFDKETGIKVTKFLTNSTALCHNTIKQRNNLKKIADTLATLHNSKIELNNEFNVFEEYQHYLSLLKNKNAFFEYNSDINDVIQLFEIFSCLNKQEKINLVPCHNDLVPENILVKQKECYFIDWEYSGMNDPLFDIAALFLESNFDLEEQQLFLNFYYKEEFNFLELTEKITHYQFCQDVLWFLWTLIKAENNEHFSGYAEKRIERAIKFMKKYSNKQQATSNKQF
ncbi:phosphotransferase [Neisseria lisongii]|uniref:Choline kinase family protein n=1 Tax=Neisseria lisongii TaxID=2912188 RepID=A0AAW5AQ08_9NEIS|nr:choline kinase family protein [Neisseria lisongii]MCF7530282.1 choline kinase family protein [Neisseria lisongii]